MIPQEETEEMLAKVEELESELVRLKTFLSNRLKGVEGFDDWDCYGHDTSNVMLADGFEDAFVGLVSRYGWSDPVAVYDRRRCIEILMDRDEMDYCAAVEFYEYNVIGSWVGDTTPVYLDRCTIHQVHEGAD